MANDYIDHCNTGVLADLGHTLVGVSDNNKEDLLSVAYENSRERMPQAREICARLSQLKPEVSALFKPKDDVLPSLSLRMIVAAANAQTSACQGSAEDLATAAEVQSPLARNIPSFLAISYAWHHSDWTPAAAATPIAPGWEISQPMIDAVLACRESDEEAVWLDKLCINQADENDKTTHIGVMDLI